MSRHTRFPWRFLPNIWMIAMMILSISMIGVLCARAAATEKKARDLTEAIRLASDIASSFEAAADEDQWRQELIEGEKTRVVDDAIYVNYVNELTAVVIFDDAEATEYGILMRIRISILSETEEELYQTMVEKYVPGEVQ